MKTEAVAKNYDDKHLVNLAKYQKAIQNIFDKMCEEAAALGISTGFENGNGEGFTWDKYPKARKKFTDLMWRIRKDMEAVITDGVAEEWKMSNAKNDELVDSLIGNVGLTLAQIEDLEPRRLEGMQAFQARKVRGLGLSDRVWNITSLAEAQISEAIEQNLAKGTPAQKLSQAVRQNLKEPDMMYRRYWHKIKKADGTEKIVRVWHKREVDADGNVHFVEHPLEAVGKGVYRSAYKNAMRLARTETNMAYHKADSNYFASSDIILGIEIKLSNNHTTTFGEGKETKELVDICNELQGKYPRWFDFTGWHPNCRCVAMPIVPDRKEMREYLKKIANGEDVSNWKWTGEVTNMPQNFRNWCANNEDRLARMQKRGTLPYFIRENISKGFKFGYDVDIDDAMKWSPYDFEYNEDYDMLMMTEVVTPSGELQTPKEVMENTEDMIQAMLDKDMAQYAEAIQKNLEELAKAIGQKRGLSMSWEEANTSKENPHYHDKVQRYELDEKGDFIWVKKGRGYGAKETKEYEDHKQWTVNCQTCTVIHELRRRGFNVEACGNKRGSVYRVYQKKGVGSKREGYRIGKWLNEDGTPAKPFYASQWARDNGKTITSKSDVWDFFHAMMKNTGRYEIYVDWNGDNGAHVFCAEKTADGKIHFFDPQSGKEGKALIEKYLADASERLGTFGVVRTDNKLVNTKLAETFIPIGELSIELPNKPNKSDIYKAQGEARHAARTPERVAEIKAFYRAWMGRYYKKKAAERRAARSQENIEEITEFWRKKKAEGDIRRRQERWNAAKEKRVAARTQEYIDDVSKRAGERQDKIRISKIKINLAQSEWEGVKDWLPDNPLDAIKDPEWHLYDQADKADKLFAQVQIIKKNKPDYDTAAAYKSSIGKYDTMLEAAKQNIIHGDGSDAKAIFHQLDIARSMEALYVDMVAYAKAHPSKQAGKQTKIEKAMAEAEAYIADGDFYNAKIKVEEAKKTRDINEASNAAKAAKRKAEEEARKKAEEEAKKKAEEGKKAFDEAKDADELFDVYLGDNCPKMLKDKATYKKSVARETYTSQEYIDNKDEIEKKLKDFFDNVDYCHNVYGFLLDIKAPFKQHRYSGTVKNGEGIYINRGISTNLTLDEVGKQVWNDPNWSYKGESYNEGRRTYGHWAYGLRKQKRGYVPEDEWLENNEYYNCGTPVPKGDLQAAYESGLKGGAFGYGDCQIILRKDRVVATWTFGNSLGEDTIPSLVNEPKVCSIDAKRFVHWKDTEYRDPNRMIEDSWESYIEMQYLPLRKEGYVSPKDFQSITFTKGNPEGIISKDAIDLWYEYGVDLYYVENGKVKLYKKGKPQITQEEAKVKLEKMKSVTDAWLNDPGSVESKDLSLADVAKLLKGKDYVAAYEEVEKVKKEIEKINKRRDAVRALVPDVDKWNKQFTMDEIEKAHKAIKGFKDWFETKYTYRGVEAKEIAKLQKEMDKAQSDEAKAKYKTWQISRDAYKRMRDEKIYQYRRTSIEDNIARLKAYKTKDKNFLGMVKDIEDLASKGAWGDVEELITSAKNEMLILQQNSGEHVLKLGESSLVRFSNEEFTQAKRDAAKWFKDDDVKKAYKAADDYMWKNCKELWAKLTDEEKHILWLYTDGSKYINDEMLGAYSLVCQSPIDGTLRNGFADANVLTSIIEKAPTLKEAMWMQSGKSLGAFKGIFGVDIEKVSDLSSLVGMEGYNSIFMSCHAAANGYFVKGGSTGTSNPVVLSVYMPKGTKGAYLEPIASYGDSLRWKDGLDFTGNKRRCDPSDQVEYLLQRGAKFKITKAYYKDGKYYVDVDLIEQASVSALDESQMEKNLPTGYRRIRKSRKPTLM